MYKPASLHRELLFVGVAMLVLWGLCELADLSYWILAVAAAGYLCWHLYHLWSLARWLDGGNDQLLLDAPGVWGHVYQRLEVKRRKAAKRKKQVGRLLKQFKSSTRALPDATIVLDKKFHIQWLNKFLFFDRIILNLYYKMLGKKLVFTAHNVDMRERDNRNSFWSSPISAHVPKS